MLKMLDVLVSSFIGAAIGSFMGVKLCKKEIADFVLELQNRQNPNVRTFDHGERSIENLLTED